MIRQGKFCVLVISLAILLASRAVTFVQPRQQSLASAPFVGAVISCSAVTPTPGNYVVAIESSGQTREFRLHIPPGYLPDQAAPLVINLHGAGGSGLQQEMYSRMSSKANEAGFIAVYPEGRGDPSSWYVGPTVGGRQEDVQFMRDLVACLENQLRVDADRIYATGFSNGGGMANRLGCDLSDIIAAIGPVSGTYFFPDDCQPSRPVPVVAFHGTADSIVPYNGGTELPPIPQWAAEWAARNSCDPASTITYSHGDVTGETWGNCDDDASVTLYTVAGGTHAWPGAVGATQDITATDTIWEFFAAHPFNTLSHHVYLPLVARP